MRLVQVYVRVTLLEVLTGLRVVGAEPFGFLHPHIRWQAEEVLHAGFDDRVLVQALRGPRRLVVQCCFHLCGSAGGVDQSGVFWFGGCGVGGEDADGTGGAGNGSAQKWLA